MPAFVVTANQEIRLPNELSRKAKVFAVFCLAPSRATGIKVPHAARRGGLNMEV